MNPTGKKCARLCEICMDALLPLLEDLGKKMDMSSAAGPLDKLAGEVIEALMQRAYQKTGVWTPYWLVFLTPKIKKALLPWDKSALSMARKRCKLLRQVLITSRDVKFKVSMLSELPPKVSVLDFDGELFFRGMECLMVLPHKDRTISWLPEAESILRAMDVMKVAAEGSFTGTPGTLSEIHLGRCAATSQDIADLLRYLPQLKTLRHYQLAAALCLLHGQDWKEKPAPNLPKYKLTNIDADFSHVVRSRMSPGWVLPVDALRLAVVLCPEAVDVRLRFDCSTPHDVAAPLAGLVCLTRLSAVCVTSGERTLLDFTDLVPLLEQFGSSSLIALELKVLEEVDPHVILRHCARLEVLTLSGCGFVTPATCGPHGCVLQAGQAQSTPQPNYQLPQLRLLFYADGDDFSWDHYLPQCFWKAVLFSGDRRKTNKLEGMFLESPRMSAETLDTVFREKCLPLLRVLSLCRVPEVTMEHILAASPTAYLRVSKCEQIKPRHATRIRHLTKIEVKHE